MARTFSIAVLTLLLFTSCGRDNNAQTNNAQTNNAQTNNAQTNNTQTNNAQTNNAQTNNQTVGDTTAPTIVSVWPADGATTVDHDELVVVSFNEPIDAATVTEARFVVAQADGSPVVGLLETVDHAITFTPEERFEEGVGYAVTVGSGIEDVSGNATTNDFTFGFSTRRLEWRTTLELQSSLDGLGTTGTGFDADGTAYRLVYDGSDTMRVVANNNGPAWADVTTVGEDVGDIRSASLLQVPTGELVIIWAQEDASATNHLWLQTFDPTTMTLGSAEMVSPPISSIARYTATSSKDGTVTLVWSVNEGPTYAVYARRWDLTTGLGDITTVAVGAGSNTTLTVAANAAGDVLCLARLNENPGYRTYSMFHSGDDAWTSSWTAPQPLDADPAYLLLNMNDSGDVEAIVSMGQRLSHMRYTAGNGWTTAAPLTAVDTPETWARLHQQDNGDLVLHFIKRRDGSAGSQPMTTTYDLAAQTWSPAAPLFDDAADPLASDFSGGMTTFGDGAGRWIVVWWDTVGTGGARMLTRRYLPLIDQWTETELLWTSAFDIMAMRGFDGALAADGSRAAVMWVADRLAPGDTQLLAAAVLE